MKAEVAFTFDATSLDGKQLVPFEEVYDLSNPDEPKKVPEHKDMDTDIPNKFKITHFQR